MSNPSKSLRLQVIDRFVTVLAAVTAGEEYWKTPDVRKRWTEPGSADTFPIYGVFAGDGSAPEEDSGEYREEFEVIVKGVVKDDSDTVTAMEHALQDVRRAIDKDSRDGSTAGALGTLTVYLRLGTSATDEGEWVATGMGFIEQRFIVGIAADPFGA